MGFLLEKVAFLGGDNFPIGTFHWAQFNRRLKNVCGKHKSAFLF